MLDVLRDCASRDARVMSVCSGAFTLDAAGLPDGRTCASHWRFLRLLSLLYPDAAVDLDVLQVVAGKLGSEVANVIARRMIVAPHRSRGQRQCIDHQALIETGDAGLQQVMEGAVEHPDRDHAVPVLAAARLIREIGLTPHEDRP